MSQGARMLGVFLHHNEKEQLLPLLLTIDSESAFVTLSLDHYK